MPIQLIIHHDNGISEVAAEGTWQEVEQAIPHVLAQVNPDEALWEFKEVPTPCNPEKAQQLSTHIMGANGKH